MVSFNDVLNGLKKILSNSFTGYKIYFEEPKQELKRPCFFIQVLPLSSNNFNIYFREQRCMIDISYFSSDDPDLQKNFDNMTMANKLENVINTDLKVLDRNINVQELQFEVIDRLLHTNFEIMWYNENEVTEAYLNQFQIMEHFTVDIDGIGCSEYFITSEAEIFRSTNSGFYVKCTDAEIEMLRDRNLIKI